ncbi:uncharacterized protein I206_106957 [Kwoniella pini CBS 10737]|uniref:Copper transport protein n=1 Tax=Kwoniella pini CBS 10737 TaxID=1296096 RepID=A0A1B9HZN1_9TREE|nr:uncharacterized protein I206_05501 [Kwoniella pini CBS 10737]OCF48720.1 hypothetical protein I206_05501 [Kwoniella pini CBS 10737]
MDSMSGMDDMSSTGSGSMTMKMYFHGSIGTDMLWFASWMPTSAGATVGVCIGLFLFAIFERYLVAFRRACDASWRKGLLGYSKPVSEGLIPSSSTGTTSSIASQPNLISRKSANEKNEYDQTLPTTSNYPVTQDGYNNSSSGSVPSYSPNLNANGKEKESDDNYDYSHLPKAVRKTLDPGREGRWSRPFRWGVDLPRGLLQALQVLIHYLLMLVVMTFNIWWIISVVVGSGVGEMMFGRFGSSHIGH